MIKSWKIENATKHLSFWWLTAIIYGFAIILTFILLKLPNLIGELSSALLNFKAPFNWNHGFALGMTTILGYSLFATQKNTHLFGTDKLKSTLFALILLFAYSIVGISNKYGINPHVWALIFVTSTLIYDLLEESFWRGYLNDLLRPRYLAVKYTVTGALWSVWHLLIFDNFDQWGGFHIYLMLSIIVSFIIGFATAKTSSILVAASIHALLINKNPYVTIGCLILWAVLIITWQRKSFMTRK